MAEITVIIVNCTIGTQLMETGFDKIVSKTENFPKPVYLSEVNYLTALCNVIVFTEMPDVDD